MKKGEGVVGKGGGGVWRREKYGMGGWGGWGG